MRYDYALFAALFFLAPSVSAGQSAIDAPRIAIPADVNALQPDGDQFPDYHSAEQRVFKDAFADDVIARVVVEPSFGSEYAIGLVLREGKYNLFMLEPDDQIWSFTILSMMKEGAITSSDNQGHSTTSAQIKQLQNSLPPHPEDLKIARCDVRVPGNIAVRILEAWKAMLTSPVATKRFGLDGAFFHFGLRDHGTILTGRTWSPSENTNPYRLVLIALAMRDACQTESGAALSSIPALADAIGANMN